MLGYSIEWTFKIWCGGSGRSSADK